MSKPPTKAAAQAATEQTVTAEPQPLDPVIEATARRQNLMGQAGAFLGLPPSGVYNVLRGIWTTSKGQEPLTDQEMRQGVALVARYELDPFAREIYVSRDKQGHPMVIIGIDGWIKVLDRTDHYDGMEQELLWKGGEKTDPGNCYAVITRIHSTKRHKPATYIAYRSEYAEVAGFMNSKIPLHMLRIFSLRHAARLFAPLGGCFMEEEARGMSDAADEPVPAKTLDDLTAKIGAKIIADAASNGVDLSEQAKAALLEDLAAEPKPDPPFQAQCDPAADLAADRAQLADDYASAFAQEKSASGVAEKWESLLADIAGGRVDPDQKAPLAELANAAKDRLSKV